MPAGMSLPVRCQRPHITYVSMPLTTAAWGGVDVRKE